MSEAFSAGAADPARPVEWWHLVWRTAGSARCLLCGHAALSHWWAAACTECGLAASEKRTRREFAGECPLSLPPEVEKQITAAAVAAVLTA